MYVELPLLSNGICEKLLGDLIYIGPSIFCAGYEEGTKDSCQVNLYYTQKKKKRK